MKMPNGVSRKMRYGSASAGITAAVLCGVLLLNILATALCSQFLWHIDLTPEPLYTLEDETSFLLEQTLSAVDAKRDPKDPVQVDIIFCADPDQLCGNERTRAVYYTALELQKAFPANINVSTCDVWNNPSAVDAYRTNAYTSIYPSHVIVASGSEFRVYNNDAFYSFYSDDLKKPFAYSGEKTFVKGILAVTRAEAPICALTVNHGEPFATEEGRAEYSEFLRVIEGAGYDIVYLDLEKDAIPENCRLIITFDPQTDFASDFFGAEVSEVARLDAYLEQSYSYMIFADADTPKLTNLEEYLEEWGIVFDRYNKGNAYEVIDTSASLAPDGKVIIGQYETEGGGGSITQEMRAHTAPPKIIFGNALSISLSPTYTQTYVLADEEKGTGAFTYGTYMKNMVTRNLYDVFRTSNLAYANAKENGAPVIDAQGEPVRKTDSPFKLMTMSEQVRMISEGVGYTNATNNSYVCAVGSVEFASNSSLTSNAYGNADALLSTLRSIGKEVVPVGLEFKDLRQIEITEKYNARETAVLQTVLLTALPAVLTVCVGGVVLIKRKYRK